MLDFALVVQVCTSIAASVWPNKQYP
eukprot:SAG11_NODE_15605_length_572_cov_0.961945_1_plen_25_part_10